MDDSSKVLLQVRGLNKSFYKNKAEISVLRNMNFNVYEGELIAITGASGAGKSTLLHVLGTLEYPSSGEILFGTNKESIFQYSEKKLAEFRNRMLGFVFQFHYLLPEFSALENVMMPALIAGHPRRSAQRQAEELLVFVGLKHRLHHRPSELSGGEQQRVAITRAVVLRPRLLFADELTGNLDSVNSELVMDLLVQLNQAMGVTIVMVTHNEELAHRTRRILVMKDGCFMS